LKCFIGLSLTLLRIYIYIYIVIGLFYYVHVTYCMCVQCKLYTNPTPTGIPLPGRGAHRTAGTNLGSAGPRPNIKGNTLDLGIEPEGSQLPNNT